MANADKNKIIEYLRKLESEIGENSGATLKEIAKGLDWSQSLTYDKLVELQEDEKIEVVADGKKAHVYKLATKKDSLSEPSVPRSE